MPDKEQHHAARELDILRVYTLNAAGMLVAACPVEAFIMFAKFKLGGLLIAGLVASASPAYAATCSNNANCSGKIAELYPSPSDDQVYVSLSGPIPIATTTCAELSNKYYVMALNTDTKRATWQLLVAAFLAGKSVNVRLNVAAGQCIIQYITVTE
jgi:hypothetical protein